MTNHWLLAALVLAASNQAPSMTPPLRERVCSQQFVFVAHPARLPDDVRSGLAAVFHQTELNLAAPNQPFNQSCLIDPRLPLRRMVAAAVGPQFAVVHFETSGFAHTDHLVVLERTNRHTVAVWRGVPSQPLADASVFVRQLRDCTLFDGAKDVPLD